MPRVRRFEYPEMFMSESEMERELDGNAGAARLRKGGAEPDGASISNHCQTLQRNDIMNTTGQDGFPLQDLGRAASPSR